MITFGYIDFEILENHDDDDDDDNDKEYEINDYDYDYDYDYDDDIDQPSDKDNTTPVPLINIIIINKYLYTFKFQHLQHWNAIQLKIHELVAADPNYNKRKGWTKNLINQVRKAVNFELNICKNKIRTYLEK